MSANLTKLANTALSGVKFTPYWLDNAARPTAEAALTADTNCDLLIVGGGFTGLWAAVQAAEQHPDRKIILIEAKEIANGATGRPGGIVSTSVTHGLSEAEHNYPAELDILQQLGKDNIDDFADFIKRHNIDCDIEWGGELTVAVGKGGLPVLNHEKSLHDRYDDDVVVLNKEETEAELKSPLFDGAMWNRVQSGTVHPAKLAWGLKKTALKLGVILYENTPLHYTKKQKAGILVKTPTGQIVAKKILLGTNAFAAGGRKIRNRVAAIRDRIIATKPLSDEQLARIGWKNRQGVYDTRAQLNYMRLTKDNSIIFGGRLAYYYGNDTDPAGDKVVDPFIRLAEAFFRTFPELDDVEFSHAWSGPIGLTTRKMVHFRHFYNGDMIYAGGYSGFGVTATRFGSRIALALLEGKDFPEKSLEFVDTIPGWLPPEPFRWIGAQITMYALDTLDEKGGWRKPWIALVEKMGFPLTIS